MLVPQAVLVELAKGLSLIPLPEELIEAITKGEPSVVLPPFHYLTDQLEARILQLIGAEVVGYLEADYFGGQGQQAVVLWQGGQQHFALGPGYGAINAVLQYFGVRCGSVNEFDAIRLGRHWHTDDGGPA